MLSLTEFLLARIAEDEADPWRGAELIGSDRVVGQAECEALAAEEDEWEARVLAECEAKRRIVELHPRDDEGFCGDNVGLVGCKWLWPCPTLHALALPYADHDHFQEEWRV